MKLLTESFFGNPDMYLFAISVFGQSFLIKEILVIRLYVP